MTKNSITVDIVSDIVCPWCWLGKQHFDTAHKAAPDLDIKITWRPFMLDANLPEAGMAYGEYMQKKFGTGRSDKFKAMRAHLEEAAGPAGIEFKFDHIPLRPNTLKAHLLLKWADEKGKAHQMSEALFKAFFQDLKDIGNTDILCAIAGDVGMDAAVLKQRYKDSQDVQALKDELAYFQNLGVNSVPTFIYNGKFAVSGGQPPEVHAQALAKAAQ